jgi:hypothetical protein
MEAAKALLGRNVQILLASANPWKTVWVIGRIIALEDALVIVKKYGGGDISIPLSEIAATIRLADFS